MKSLFNHLQFTLARQCGCLALRLVVVEREAPIMPELSLNTPISVDQQKTRFSNAYSVLEEAIHAGAFPGAAFGVLSHGQVVLLDAVGSFTYEVGAHDVAPDTAFDVASLTKVVATTSAAMILYDRGVLDLDMPVGEVLPGFVIGKAPGSKKQLVTMRMLLAHSSGLPAYARLFETAKTSSDLLRAALLMPLESAPMERAVYSDIGYILLGKAIEVLCGVSLDEFCRREVFTPLGMTSTTFRPAKQLRQAIPPTEMDAAFRRRTIQGEVNDENCSVLGGCAGHAGLFSPVPDLLAFAQIILEPEASGSIFRSETVSLFNTKRVFPAGTTRALGWDTPSEPSSSGHYFGPRSIGHLGFTGTSIWIDPDRRLAVVLLTNRIWPDRSSQAIKQVRPAFHDAVVRTLIGA
jgi:serine-type D-Ala-D-Ala carboxypeptidase